jgi:hypothetical protein
MTRRRAGTALLAVLIVAGWLLLALGSGPAGPHEYRTAARQAASGALSGVRTVVLAGRAKLGGKVLDPYLSVLFDNATEMARTTQSNLAGKSPPDDATRAIRDELAPLLADAVRDIGDVVLAADASDDTALVKAVDALARLGDQLSGFLARHR